MITSTRKLTRNKKSKKYRYSGITIGPKKFKPSQIKFYIILLPFVAYMLLPICYIFFHAFKRPDELFAFPPIFITRRPTLENFKALFQMMKSSNIPASRYLFNNIIITISVMVLSIITSVMAGYALSKKRFRGQETIFTINIVALMFVPVAVTIPRFLVVENLGLIDTYLAHILPSIAVPVEMFLIKQFIDQLPDSLIEAAQIDGANDIYIIRKIVFPMIKPAVTTVAILTFQTVWNDVTTSRIYINDETLRTFAFYFGNLSSVAGNVVAGQGMAAAAALIMFIPNLVIFIFMQSKVLNTMAYSGIR
jgi:ABC-type glycerol-3-phosphate transport system permease component